MVSSSDPVNFDSVTKLLGFGRFQWLSLCLSGICSALSGALIILPILAGYQVDYRCYVPGCDTNTTEFLEDFLPDSTPWDNSTDNWRKCARYFSDDDLECYSKSFQTSDVVTNCSNYIYDQQLFTSTTVSEFGLTCSNSGWASIHGAVYQIGAMIGCIFLGFISDLYGRKVGTLISLGSVIIGVSMGALMPTYWAFLLFVLFTGPGGVGIFQTPFVAALEYVGIKWKTFSGVAVNIFYTFGELYTVLISYFLRDFRYLHASIIVFALPLVSLYWLFPESARWLLSQGRLEEAKEIVDRAAKMNGKDSPAYLLDQIKLDQVGSQSEPSSGRNNRSIVHLFKLPAIRKRFIILCFCWLVCAMVYFGLSSNVGNLSGDVFSNLAITIAVEIPANIVTFGLLERLGRKGCHVLVFILGGISCIVSAYTMTALPLLGLILSFVGKFGITIAFTGICVYTGEIFPTEYRTIGFGACIAFSRIGGSLAPIITGMAGAYYTQLPMIIFGIMSLLAGFLVVFLPETQGVELPQTLEESEALGKGASIFRFGPVRK